MSEEILIRDTRGHVAELTLNRPKALNALSDGMLARLSDELKALADDQSVRVVVIRGAGKAFCAGHDLREMQAGRQAEDGGQAYFSDLFARCGAVMQAIRALPQPVIAEVHGIATAAGCQLVASCDLAVAAEGTRFGVNGVNIGLFCSTPMVALSRNIGTKKTFEMLVTGGFLGAGEAQAHGLVNRIVPEDQLGPETAALADLVASKLTGAVKIGKRAFYEQLEMPIAEAYAHTAQVMVENMLWRDTDEGIQAFLEKRPPDWAD